MRVGSGTASDRPLAGGRKRHNPDPAHQGSVTVASASSESTDPSAGWAESGDLVVVVGRGVIVVLSSSLSSLASLTPMGRVGLWSLVAGGR